MLSPNAEQIETAADQLKTVSEFIKKSQMKERSSFDSARAQAIGVSDVTEDFKINYAPAYRQPVS